MEHVPAGEDGLSRARREAAGGVAAAPATAGGRMGLMHART
ncbi:hypothetical protein [Nonomuraea candida]|nr:hypothetical protein [Nonomuraea candida]